MLKPSLNLFTCLVFANFLSVAFSNEPMRIRLKDGSFGTGHIVAVQDSQHLGWQCDAFDTPLKFEIDAVRSLNRVADGVAADQQGDASKAPQRYFFELANGAMVVGQLESIDANWITVGTELLGQVKLDRQRTRSMVDAKYAGQLIYSGPAEDGLWQGLGEDTDWEFEGGALVATKQRAMIVGNIQLPSKSQISLSLSWKGVPDFVISLGTQRITASTKTEEFASAARLEVWANQLALVREVDGGADIAMLSELNEANPRIDLTVYLDQVSGVVRVCDVHGRPLETLTVPAKNTPSRPSVHIASNGPSLTLERLEVREWDGLIENIAKAGQHSVLIGDGQPLAAAIVGFDADIQQLLLQSSDGKETSLELSELRRGDFSIPRASGESSANTDLPPTVVQPAPLGADTKAVANSQTNSSTDAGGDTGPAGKAAAMADDSDSLVVDEIELILEDRTRLKGKWLEAASEQLLRFEASGFQDQIRFSVDTVSGIIGTAGRYTSDETEKTVGTIIVGDNQFKGYFEDSTQAEYESGLCWHPLGSSSPSAISVEVSGAIVYREPLPKIQEEPTSEKTPPFRVLAPGIGMFLGGRKPAAKPEGKESGNNKPDKTQLDAREIMFRAGDAIDGIVERIDERGMTFHSEQSSTTFAPHELINHVWLNKMRNTTQTSPEQMARLMTVPRSMKQDPPTHLFIATTGDYLRGRLVSLEGDKLTVEIRLEIVEMPAANIAQIIWLHDRDWDEKKKNSDADADQSEQKPAEESSDPSPFLVHAIGKSDRGLTFHPLKVADGQLSGRSDLLGDCSIAIKDLRQLLFGRNIAEQVRAYREDPWTLSLAQYPRVYLDDGSDNGSAGSTSPLVGKPATDFTLKSLTGQGFRLSKHRDRVVVLDFWASWCGPCIQTMPLVEKVVEELGSDKIQLVAVNIQESAAKAQAAVDRLELDATVLLDSDGQTAAAYAANAIPQTVIIDRSGKVTHLFVGGGPRFVEQFKEALQSVLNTPE